MNERRMPDGTTLAEELINAMGRIGRLGVVYPAGYSDTIIKKYTLETVPYPYIVMHIGDPRIRRHFFYRELLIKPGEFLDYGCGTGDTIRQLIRDGYPADRINGFDVNDGSLRLGYDLYLDKDEIERLVTVAPAFSCPPERYGFVYSGSVIHVLGEEKEFLDYLGKAYRTLKPGGIFFGSTLGLDDKATGRGRDGPPRLMRKYELRASLWNSGFKNVRIVLEERPEPERRGLNFCLYQFSAEKGE